MKMSRAFTSEEYEQKEVPIVIPPKIEETPDHDIVMRYSHGRSLEDPKLPYEIGMGFLKGEGEFFRSDEFAVKWLERAVKMGYAPAMVALAEFCLKDTKTYGFRRPARRPTSVLMRRRRTSTCPRYPIPPPRRPTPPTASTANWAISRHVWH